MSLIPNLVEGSILIAPILTIEYLHGYRKNTAKNKHRLNFPDDVDIQALQKDFPAMLNQLKYTLEIENTIEQPPKQEERLQKLNRLMLPINTQEAELPDIPPY